MHHKGVRRFRVTARIVFVKLLAQINVRLHIATQLQIS
jgi:hypothetical protein